MLTSHPLVWYTFRLFLSFLHNPSGLNVCCSPTPYCGGIRRWSLWEVFRGRLSHEVGASMMELGDFQEEREISLCIHVHRGMAPSAGTLILDCQASRNCEKINF